LVFFPIVLILIQKLRKKVWYGSEFITTDYLDGFQYVDEELVFFPHAEGYVNVTKCLDCQTPKYVFNYVFQYKDHLGNIRMNYGYDEMDETLKIMEENHYYPFGLKHTQYNSDGKKYEPSEENPEVMQIKDLPPGEQFLNKYKFQEQERQDELGLNWDSFKYRNYDYAIGRFMSIDPLAEDYVYNGPYNFAENRVIDGRELEGLEWTPGNQIQQWSGAFREMGETALHILDNIGLRQEASITLGREIAPATNVENTTTVTSGSNIYNWGMNSFYSNGTSTTMPFTFDITNDTKLVTEVSATTKAGPVQVTGSLTNEVNLKNGETTKTGKVVIGSGNNGAFVSKSKGSNDKKSTIRAGIQGEISTPKTAGAYIKVSGSLSIGQKPEPKTTPNNKSRKNKD
jgi:RHS repeat-associated protein